MAVRFNARRTDPFDKQWVGNGDRGDLRRQEIVEMPGVRGRLEHHGIGRLQMLLAPEFELVPGQSVRTQNHLLVDVHRTDHHGTFVNIQSDKAGDWDVGCGHETSSWLDANEPLR